MNNTELSSLIESTRNWFYCDNIVHPDHINQFGLLHLGEPSVFILIRDMDDAYFASYEEFCSMIAEVNFLYPEEREKTDLDSLLTDAWNFLSLQEEQEENIYEEWEDDDL